MGKAAIRLQAEYAGVTTVLNFWRNWVENTN